MALARSHCNLGKLQCALGRTDEGLASYEQAHESLERRFEQDPQNALFGVEVAVVCRSVAWLQATDPTENVLDGERAVSFATKACELTNWQIAPTIDTLAAAYAESGDFAKAIETERKAIELATPEARPAMEARLELYKAGKPYREPLPEPPEASPATPTQDSADTEAPPPDPNGGK